MDDAGGRLARAWARHPVVAFAEDRRRIAFYSQLLAAIKSGLGMPLALRSLTRYAPGERLRRALASVQRDVARGSTLVEALGRHEAAFDGLSLELLAAGEESGNLEPVLSQLVEHLDRLRKLRLKALAGAIYPAYLLATLTFVGPLLELSGAIRGGETSGGLFGVYVSGVPWAFLAGPAAGLPGAASAGPSGPMRNSGGVSAAEAPRWRGAPTRHTLAVCLSVDRRADARRVRGATTPARMHRPPGRRWTCASDHW